MSKNLIFCWLLVSALAFTSGQAMAGDADDGQKVFKSQCTACHSNQQGKNIVGPSLYGVVGRKAGQIPGFHYSEANRSSGLTWDAATLDRYLTSPRGVVPGTLMTYPGLKDDAKRADLISYLATLK
jgi:cytochrome c